MKNLTFVFQRAFHYVSHFWTNKKEYNLRGGKTGFDTQETKSPSFWKTNFSKICLGMRISNQTKFMSINIKASSLHSLIADGIYRPTSLGRIYWKQCSALRLPGRPIAIERVLTLLASALTQPSMLGQE